MRLLPRRKPISMRRSRLVVWLALGGLFGLVGQTPLFAAGPTCTVNGTGGGNYTTIQAALNVAGCTTINVASGTYTENLVVSRSITIAGAGPSATIIDGGINSASLCQSEISGDGRRTITISPGVGPVTITGVTVQHGCVNELLGKSPTGVGTPLEGGGIFHHRVLNLSNAVVTNNYVFGFDAGGGGIAAETALAVLNLSNVTISNNVATEGAGLDIDGNATLNKVTINNNAATVDGGGINLGVAQASSLLSMVNVTISGNSAGRNGGGLYVVAGSSATVTNVTLSGNSAAKGGGVFAEILQGSLTLKNTLIANSPSGGSCNGTGLGSVGHNLSSDASCGFVGAGDQNGVNPLLGALVLNAPGQTKTHALLKTSPAIDKGDNNGCPSTDQRGIARPQDGDGNGSAICDIGAYEVLAAIPSPTAPPSPRPVSEVPESDTGMLLANGLVGTATWVGWQWRRLRRRPQ